MTRILIVRAKKYIKQNTQAGIAGFMKYFFLPAKMTITTTGVISFMGVSELQQYFHNFSHIIDIFYRRHTQNHLTYYIPSISLNPKITDTIPHHTEDLHTLHNIGSWGLLAQHSFSILVWLLKTKNETMNICSFLYMLEDLFQNSGLATMNFSV